MTSDQQIEQIQNLQNVINETSGTAITLSPKQEGWTGYLLQQKQKFEGKTLPELCATIAKEIVAKRTPVGSESKRNKNNKPFKYAV